MSILQAPWKPGGTMHSDSRRRSRRAHGLPTWRLVRYADDFVVLVHGTEDDTEALREDVGRVLTPMGLRLSPAKPRSCTSATGRLPGGPANPHGADRIANP
jgi:RNA-directed DNA polymerase